MRTCSNNALLKMLIVETRRHFGRPRVQCQTPADVGNYSSSLPPLITARRPVHNSELSLTLLHNYYAELAQNDVVAGRARMRSWAPPPADATRKRSVASYATSSAQVRWGRPGNFGVDLYDRRRSYCAQ